MHHLDAGHGCCDSLAIPGQETSMPPTKPRFVNQPLQGAAAWVRECPIESVPVLARTTFEIEDWLEFAEQLDLHTLASTVEDDPLMTLKLHAFLGKRLDREVDSEPDTVVGALLMLGTRNFFRQFAELASVDDILQDHPAALESFQTVMERSRRALRFAAGLAGQRGDLDAAVLREAASLHGFAEMLMWTRAPTLMETLSSGHDPEGDEAAERATLGASLAELRLEWMKAWRVPAKLVTLVNGLQGLDGLQVRIVQMSVKAARHEDLDHPQVWEVAREVADMFQMGLQPAMSLLRNSQA
jgi:hypothetical protein